MNTQAVLNFFFQNIGNILTGIIASFIVLALQSSANAFATVFSNIVLQRYRLSKLWCFPRCDRIYIISGSLEGVSQEVRNVILAGPDSDAASSAIATLGMLYPKTEIRHVYSSNFSADFAKFDFIHLCRSRGIGERISQASEERLRNYDHVGFLGRHPRNTGRPKLVAHKR